MRSPLVIRFRSSGLTDDMTALAYGQKRLERTHSEEEEEAAQVTLLGYRWRRKREREEPSEMPQK